MKTGSRGTTQIDSKAAQLESLTRMKTAHECKRADSEASSVLALTDFHQPSALYKGIIHILLSVNVVHIVLYFTGTHFN